MIARLAKLIGRSPGAISTAISGGECDDLSALLSEISHEYLKILGSSAHVE
jgi:hypothetical protein